jgi:5-formyltetrahydrofolate cyclo-ligase
VTPAEEKAALRARFRAFRESLSPEEVATRSAAICARLAVLPEVEHAETVHLYWPIPGSGEVDTRLLALWLHREGCRVVLPRVISGSPPQLRHHVFTGEDALRPNRWGILEPSGDEVEPDELDAVIVPALGAGRDGHRIGHGAGYYDVFLGTIGAPKVGAVYAECLVDRLPAEPHDVPLDAIVTESGVARIRT